MDLNMKMLCTRCRGLMVRDRFIDKLDDTGKRWFWGWRCIACGEIVDPVILINRVSPVVYKGHARRLLAAAISQNGGDR